MLPTKCEKVGKQMKKNAAVVILIIFVVFSHSLFSREFNFENDKDLAVKSTIISKSVNGTETEIIQIYLFMNLLLQEKNITISKCPPNSFGFMIPLVIDSVFFADQSKDFFTIEYDYTPVTGTLKTDREKVESFVYFNHNQEDFGGRSYCADCGEPLAYGIREMRIDNKDPIWLRNSWLDFSKGFFLDLKWICEQEPFEFNYNTM